MNRARHFCYRLMKFDESKKETTTATPIFPAQIHDAKAAIRWVREQAKTLDEKMKAVGANHTLMVFEGQGHGFGGESGKKAADATWDFFDQHLRP